MNVVNQTLPEPSATPLGRITRSDAVLIALATLAGYGFVFAYQAGLYSVYGIPLTLVGLDLPLGLSILGLFAPAVLFFIGQRIPSPLFKSWSDDKYRAVGNELLGTTVPVAAWNIIGGGSFISFLVMLGTLMLIVHVLLKYRNRRLQGNPAPTQTRTTTEADRGYLFGEALSGRSLFMLATLVALAILCFFLGRSRAQSEPSYFVVQGHRQYLVVSASSDRIIGVPMTIETTTYHAPLLGFLQVREQVVIAHDGFTIIKLGDGSALSFQLATSRRGRFLDRAGQVALDVTKTAAPTSCAESRPTARSCHLRWRPPSS